MSVLSPKLNITYAKKPNYLSMTVSYHCDTLTSALAKYSVMKALAQRS